MSKTVKLPEKTKTELKFVVPDFFPVNGRIVTQAVNKKTVKTKGGIIIEDAIVSEEVDNRSTQNPLKGKDFYVVKTANDVNHAMSKTNSLPKVLGKLISSGNTKEIEVPIEPLDKLIVSGRMEPITIKEGDQIYYLWHYIDIQGFWKDPRNMERLFKKAGLQTG